MTSYTLTISEADYDWLIAHLFAAPDLERAAYVICRMSDDGSEIRLLARETIAVDRSDILEASRTHMSISSRSLTRAMKRADEQAGSLLFVHSHPDGYPVHSPQDDEEEAKFFRTAYNRIRNTCIHGSLVFSCSKLSSARVWLPDGRIALIERVRIIGKRFRYWFPDQLTDPIPEFFDRQIRAFGPDLQRLLKRLRVGIVGAGGTGSCIAEQLTRIGVGSLLIADGEVLEASNVNRVYGSRVIDDGIQKVRLIQRLVADIGLGTELSLIARPITFHSVLEKFRGCDVVFGCTDDQWGRSLLNKLAIYYLIPVFDMGVRVDSIDGTIRAVEGRVTTLLPGAACLYCRGRITPEGVAGESLRTLDPERAEGLEEEGYIPELGEPAPAVVPFTTAVAASAISELLHRLTGFLGSDRESTEVIHLFDDTRLRTNNRPGQPDCFCADRRFWGRGDVERFLDVIWRPE